MVIFRSTAEAVDHFDFSGDGTEQIASDCLRDKKYK